MTEHFVTFTLRVEDGVFGGSRDIPGILRWLRSQRGVLGVSAREEFPPEEAEP